MSQRCVQPDVPVLEEESGRASDLPRHHPSHRRLDTFTRDGRRSRRFLLEPRRVVAIDQNEEIRGDIFRRRLREPCAVIPSDGHGFEGNGNHPYRSPEQNLEKHTSPAGGDERKRIRERGFDGCLSQLRWREDCAVMCFDLSVFFLFNVSTTPGIEDRIFLAGMKILKKFRRNCFFRNCF